MLKKLPRVKRIAFIFLHTAIVALLTIVTQIGGIAYLLGYWLNKYFVLVKRLGHLIYFVIIYGALTYLIVPLVAPIFGREKIIDSQKIMPSTIFTKILNRNYVRPELNYFLKEVSTQLVHNQVNIKYLDAGFPFIDGFPLFPHRSHNDGKKVDLSFIYETNDGKLTNLIKSVSGYGVFEVPVKNEFDQNEICRKKGHFQYDFPKYLTFGKKNQELSFSNVGNKQLIDALLQNKRIKKIFIEAHLKNRIQLNSHILRFQGCGSVRHDDHIHLEIH